MARLIGRILLWWVGLAAALVFLAAVVGAQTPSACEDRLAVQTEQLAQAQELVSYYSARLAATSATLKKLQAEADAAKKKPEEKK